eukprot:scaffold44783_cov43-Attheya_sp.AAC.1
MLTSPLPNDWQSFFVERETNPATNAKMDGLANLFPEATPTPECVKTLTEEDKAVFMTINPITKKVELAHHFSKFCGTRLQPEALYSALVGFDDTAHPVMIDPASLFWSQTIRVPVWDSIKVCKSKQGSAYGPFRYSRQHSRGSHRCCAFRRFLHKKCGSSPATFSL